MKREYDFSKAERGKEEVQSFLLEKGAEQEHTSGPLVNDLLKRDIEALHALD